MISLKLLSTEHLVQLKSSIEQVLEERSLNDAVCNSRARLNRAAWLEWRAKFYEWAEDAGVKIQVDADRTTTGYWHVVVYLTYPRGPAVWRGAVKKTKDAATEEAIKFLMRDFKIRLMTDPDYRPYTNDEKDGEEGDNGDSLHKPWLTVEKLDDELESYMCGH